MSIQNNPEKIKFYTFQNPTFLLNIFIIIVLVLVYKKATGFQNIVYLIFYIVFFVWLILRALFMSIKNESLCFTQDSVIYKRNLLNICIKEISVKKSDIISIRYNKADDGIRIKFRNFYTKSIWLIRYYSIKLLYKKSNINQNENMFIGPYNKDISEILIKYGF